MTVQLTDAGMTTRQTVVIDAALEPLIPKFLAHRRAEVVTLGDHLQVGDFEAIRRVAHTVKGVGASYGFDRITDIAIELETAAKHADTAGCGAAILALRDYLDRVDVVF